MENKNKKLIRISGGDGKGELKSLYYCPNCNQKRFHIWVLTEHYDDGSQKSYWKCPNCETIHE